ncbi:hypothetical protein [Vibrio phage BONAISHI]|nr:hypothetical protein [Vibrio phage BONAISHI]
MNKNDIIRLHKQTKDGLVGTNWVIVNNALYARLKAISDRTGLSVISSYKQGVSYPHSHCVMANNTIFHVTADFHGKGRLIDLKKRSVKEGFMPVYDLTEDKAFIKDQLVFKDGQLCRCVNDSVTAKDLELVDVKAGMFIRSFNNGQNIDGVLVEII